MSKYGDREGTALLTAAAFEAAASFEMRMPELFCGFPRSAGESPVAYPVACIPQAWSSGSIFMLLQSCLGVHVDGFQRVVRVVQPQLPFGIDNLTIRGIKLGDAEIDLEFQRTGKYVVATPRRTASGEIPVLLQV